ncbi:hypothetical protein ACNJQJ_22890, partial [Mycobacterium tuberculosis]
GAPAARPNPARRPGRAPPGPAQRVHDDDVGGAPPDVTDPDLSGPTPRAPQRNPAPALLQPLIRRYDEAKASGAPNVTNWGTGTPRRELLHVDD